MQMSTVLSEWKATTVVTIAVALVTVETTALWITGNNHCFVTLFALVIYSSAVVNCLVKMQ